MLNISKEEQEAILSSIELDHIESFDDDRDPEVYSTNINIKVSIDGSTYSVIHQRGTDGEVDLAPFDDSGLPEMYEALMKLAGEYKKGLCDYTDDIYEMFIGGNDDGFISGELESFAGDVCSKIARIAEQEQVKFDSEREEELEVTGDFTITASGHVCDLDDENAFLHFENTNAPYANMIRFEVSEKNGESWSYVRDFDCFHFHLPPEEILRRYMAIQETREEMEEHESYAGRS